MFSELKTFAIIVYDRLMMIKALRLAFFVSLLGCAFMSAQGKGFERCLPAEIDLNLAVLPESDKSTDARASKKTTVKMRLVQLNARCQKGRLVDGKGRRIYFYPLIGCWGNPPENYLELLQQQDEKIQRLKKRYTLIPCAQSVDPRTISFRFCQGSYPAYSHG